MDKDTIVKVAQLIAAQCKKKGELEDQSIEEFEKKIIFSISCAIQALSKLSADSYTLLDTDSINFECAIDGKLVEISLNCTEIDKNIH